MMEAMKMQSTVYAPIGGKVQSYWSSPAPKWKRRICCW